MARAAGLFLTRRGTGRFKWKHDGAGGVYKAMMRRELRKWAGGVRRGMDIRNAADAVAFGEARCGTPKASGSTKRDGKRVLQQRYFYYVTSTALVSLAIVEAADALHGTLCLHAIRPAGAPGKVLTRRFGCGCHSCLNRRYDECENVHVCGEWVEHEITALTEAGARQTRQLERLRQEQLAATAAESLSQGDNISIVGTDDEPFHLLKVVKPPFTLTDEMLNAQIAGEYAWPWLTVDESDNAGWVNEAVIDEDGGPWTFFWPGDEIVVGVWYQPVGGGWALYDEDWAEAPGKVDKWHGFPYVVFRSEILRHTGFSMMPEAASTRKRRGRRAAHGKMFILDEDDEEAIEASLGI